VSRTVRHNMADKVLQLALYILLDGALPTKLKGRLDPLHQLLWFPRCQS